MSLEGFDTISKEPPKMRLVKGLGHFFQFLYAEKGFDVGRYLSKPVSMSRVSLIRAEH